MHKWKTRENIQLWRWKTRLLFVFAPNQFRGHDVRVIWASPRFGHPHSKTVNGRLVIWTSPLTLTLTQIAKVVWEWDALMTRVMTGDGDAKNARMPISLWQRLSSRLQILKKPLQTNNWKAPANDAGKAHAILAQRQWRKFQLTGLYLLVMTSNLLTRLMKTCNA